MMLAHALFAAAIAATPPDSLLSADSLLVEMRKGGYTMLWRHTATDRSVREPMDYANTPRFQQRNLTDRGIADAKTVGVLFKSRGIPIGEVVSSGQAGGFIPSIDTRELVTQVHVNDGETVVLGGVYETELRNSVNKVPGLGNIPGLGYLFRSKSTSNNNAELLIFVTPKILRDGARVE